MKVNIIQCMNGTQLQRRIETEIRKQKDTQILAKASGDDFKQDVIDSQAKITKLTNKYNELCKASGLKSRKQRMSVPGYVRTKVDNITRKLKENEFFISKQENEELGNYYISMWENKKDLRPGFDEHYKELLKQREEGFKDEIIDLSTFEGCNKLVHKFNGTLYGEEIKNMDIDLIREASVSMYEAVKKCPALKEETTINWFVLQANKLEGTTLAETRFTDITLNTMYYKDKSLLLKEVNEGMEISEYVSGMNSWLTQSAKGNETKQVITHEIGHVVQKEIAQQVSFMNKNTEFFEHLEKTERGGFSTKTIKKELIEAPLRRIMEKEGLTKIQAIRKYVSIYGQTDFEEMFAEMFANSQLGKSNALADELKNYLKEIGQWID